MRTASEMYEYCIKNGYGKGFNKRNSIKHFEVVQNTLMSDENVLSAFIGLHNYVSMSKHDNNFAYAITDQRIIMGQKRVVGQVSQVISLHNINDITFKSGIVYSIIVIDTTKEEFNVAVEKSIGKNIYDNIQKILFEIKNSNTKVVCPDKENAFSKIKELKDLLDIGAITQEEYDEKKKQLLQI